MPDTGKIDVYRSGSGFGIRLDGENGFTGSVISPYYDSLLVKICSTSRTFEDAVKKSIRSIMALSSGIGSTKVHFIREKVVKETRGEKREFDVPVVPKVQIPNGLYGLKIFLMKKAPKELLSGLNPRTSCSLQTPPCGMHISP